VIGSDSGAVLNGGGGNDLMILNEAGDDDGRYRFFKLSA
jgi:hypothetical protein